MERCYKIFNELKKIYPEASCELNYNSLYELLVAVILSAQCTDKRVNLITPEFFKKYPNTKSLSQAKIEDVISIIKSCGFFNNKAKNLISMAQSVEKMGGQIPNSFEQLVSLAGVGRKTANVVLCVYYNIPAIAVDTHVFRVSNRLGISNSKNVLDCEKQLMDKFEKKDWNRLHFVLVLFGRYICTAKKPKCEQCQLKNICDKFGVKNVSR